MFFDFDLPVFPSRLCVLSEAGVRQCLLSLSVCICVHLWFIALSTGIRQIHFVHLAACAMNLPTGDGGDDGQFVTGFELGVEVVHEANIFVVDVDVDKPIEFTFGLEQTLAKVGVLGVDGFEHSLDGLAGDLELGLTIDLTAKGCGDGNGDDD
jgi:hypothetical protein